MSSDLLKLPRRDAEDGETAPFGWQRALNDERVEAQGEDAVELSLEVDQRTNGCECSAEGLSNTGDCVAEPKLLSDVVLLPVPAQRHSLPPPCVDLLLRRRKPSRGTAACLYQSGTFSFWSERWTRISCSDITRSPPFCSSFSGG